MPETSVYEQKLAFIRKMANAYKACPGVLFFLNRFFLPERFCPAKWHKEHTSASFPVAAPSASALYRGDLFDVPQAHAGIRRLGNKRKLLEGVQDESSFSVPVDIQTCH